MSRLFDILHLKFPAPQINSQKCSLEETAGEQKTGLPAWSGWANRSFVVSETPIGGGCATLYGAAAGGTTCPPLGVQGRSPGTPLVPFVVKRKEPRVWAG